MSRIQELEQKITEANITYRGGELLTLPTANGGEGERRVGSVISDKEYDTLLEELEVLDPDNSLLSNVGLSISDDDSRKENLPIPMASLNKIKTTEEVLKWIRLKNIPEDTTYIITPKFDGASLCVDEHEKSAWTRGDGVQGQRSDEHLKLISRNHNNVVSDYYSFGEVVMKRNTFVTKYSEDYSNPRNLVAGQLNHKTPNEILKDCDYLVFGMVSKLLGMTPFTTKLEELKYLNSQHKHPIAYKLVSKSELTEDYLKNLFIEWNTDYEIDGLVIEVNSTTLRSQLGRETSSNNPCYARAYKGDFEEVKSTTILKIIWEVSKKGLLKPVALVEPIELDGAVVRRVTLNNARFVKELDLGIGSVIEVKRSGMVIPKLVSVIKATGFKLPVIDGVEIKWNDNEVELVTATVTEEQRLKQLISFFEILGVENMGEGICKQFFDNGFDTPKKVLSMEVDDMLGLEKFGERKAEKIIESINDKRNVTLSKLQHASGFFNNLGSKKLLLLEDLYKNKMQVADTLLGDIVTRDGFSDISAENYINGISHYRLYEEELRGLVNISLTEVKEQVAGGNLDGMAFVFSGVRRKDLNEIIEQKGGKVVSGISKNSTHLVMKAKGTGSAKETKALSLNQTILTVEELEELLN
jgi:NAD-dependent DNA ligase